MTNEYYYLGNSTGMAKLYGADRFICVDTRSWESLIYIQGYPVEPQELSVMRRFLSPGGVFLDIGANFGLYSMVASEIIGPKGRVYAFEANPHTYKFLQKSAMANRLVWLPQYRFENLAVASENGRLEFAYDPTQLGGGHIRNAGDTADNHVIVEVPAISIDNYLPADITPDFVKVDVEGHELGVLKGMVAVIKRSPNIRLMLEYYTNTQEITEYGKDIVDFVRAQGLGLCSVEADGSLRVVPDGEIPRGNIYLLATRTPEADAASSLTTVRIIPKALNYHAVFSEVSDSLLQTDGTFRYRKEAHLTKVEPTLFFGPYINLDPGTYQLRFQGMISGSADITLTAKFGHKVLSHAVVRDFASAIKFKLDERATEFEIVLRKGRDLASLDLTEITLERV